jgi:hypothetical protein
MGDRLGGGRVAPKSHINKESLILIKFTPKQGIPYPLAHIKEKDKGSSFGSVGSKPRILQGFWRARRRKVGSEVGSQNANARSAGSGADGAKCTQK